MDLAQEPAPTTGPAAVQDTEAATVAAYLRQHLEFFQAWPELWALLVPPAEVEGAASLPSYQLRALRTSHGKLEQQLAELKAVAKENLQLMERVHALNLSLADAAGAPDVIERITAWLGSGPAPILRLFQFGRVAQPEDPDWLLALPEGGAALPEFDAEMLKTPQAGRFSNERLARLFGTAAEQVHSVALLPLASQGLLAIGSPDPARFRPGMGTVFLSMIADAVTAAWNRSCKA